MDVLDSEMVETKAWFDEEGKSPYQVQSLNIVKSFSLEIFFLLLATPVPAAPCVAVTIEDIYEDETGEEFFGETELMEPDKDLGNDASTRIPSYGRPATAVLNPLLTASATLSALAPEKIKNRGINAISPVPQNTSLPAGRKLSPARLIRFFLPCFFFCITLLTIMSRKKILLSASPRRPDHKYRKGCRRGRPNAAEGSLIRSQTSTGKPCFR